MKRQAYAHIHLCPLSNIMLNLIHTPWFNLWENLEFQYVSERDQDIIYQTFAIECKCRNDMPFRPDVHHVQDRKHMHRFECFYSKVCLHFSKVVILSRFKNEDHFHWDMRNHLPINLNFLGEAIPALELQTVNIPLNTVYRDVHYFMLSNKYSLEKKT